MDDEKVNKLRKDFEINVSGHIVPKPIISFAHL